MRFLKTFAAVAAVSLLLAHAAAAQTVAPAANPYGLSALWGQGDFIARGTLIILGIMSFSTWYILVTKLVEQNQMLRQANNANKVFWQARSVTEGTAALPPKSPFQVVAAAGVSALDHHEGTLVENIDLNTWVTLSIQRVVERIVSRLQGGLAVLATVGSTAPFIGLFGTVWGIYHALIAIGIAGQASIDKVAGPVGESLIMTALGLFTAVPAVLGYNWLVRRNKLAVEKLRGFANDLHSVLLSGKVPGRAVEAPAITQPQPRQVAVAQSA
jgi:biopolymer transport protein ExbB